MSTDTEPSLRQKIGYPELCYRCDQTVAWVLSKNARKMLMDFYPSNRGRFIIDYVGATSVVSRIPPNVMMPDDVERYTCHFDTCPKAHRPKGTTPRGKGLTGPESSSSA